MTDIIFEQDNPNDVNGTVVAVLCERGAEVGKGQRVCDIETSKVVVELRAPTAGILSHSLMVGQIVRAGSSIAQVHTHALDISPIVSTQSLPRSQKPSAEDTSRFSIAALELLSLLGGNADEFIDDFVTEDDVRNRYLLASRSILAAHSGSLPTDARLEFLSSHKREEMKILGQGAGATFLSVVGIGLVRFDIFRKGMGFFERKILDVVVSSASKLLKAYPKLNASYMDGKILYHDAINIGVAFDGSEKLLVYNVRDADKLDIAETRATIIAGYRKYVAGELTSTDVTDVTCTVTDLSGTGIDFVFPLLPAGQSCIIGISNAFAGGFRLYAGFDHRLSTGREISRFLFHLRQDVRALLDEATLPRCYRCGKSAVESGDTDILMAGVRESGDEILICRQCWK